MLTRQSSKFQEEKKEARELYVLRTSTKTRRITRKPNRDTSHLIQPRQPSQCVPIRPFRRQILPIHRIRYNPILDMSRGERVDSYPFGTQFAGHATRHLEDGAFGRVITYPFSVADGGQTGDGSANDDRAWKTEPWSIQDIIL